MVLGLLVVVEKRGYTAGSLILVAVLVEVLSCGRRRMGGVPRILTLLGLARGGGITSLGTHSRLIIEIIVL